MTLQASRGLSAELNKPFLGRSDHPHHLVEGEAPRATFRRAEDLDFDMPLFVINLSPDNVITNEIGDEVFPVWFTPNGVRERFGHGSRNPMNLPEAVYLIPSPRLERISI